MQRHSRIVLVCLLAATLVNILPRLLYATGGDYYFHATLIRCFAEQF